MAQKRFCQVDLDTGEVLEDGFVAYVVPRRVNGFGRWLSMSQDAVIFLSRAAMGDLAHEKLGLQEYVVLMCLLGYVDFENHILTPQAEMAAKIGMQRSHFSRAVRRLAELGVIEKGPKIGRMVSLRLNPNYGWKGSSANHHKALRTSEKAAKAGFRVHEGGKASAATDEALRAELEADGQGRLFD